MPSDDQPLEMWDYWRDKKGIVNALEDYYPGVLISNPDLQMALFQIKAAKVYIDAQMQKEVRDARRTKR